MSLLPPQDEAALYLAVEIDDHSRIQYILNTTNVDINSTGGSGE